MRRMPMINASLVCTMLGLGAASGCGTEEVTPGDPAQSGDLASDSSELTNGLPDDQAGFAADLVDESYDGSTTWYLPTYLGRPISPVAFRGGPGPWPGPRPGPWPGPGPGPGPGPWPGPSNDNDDNYNYVDNDDGARLFCYWQGYNAVTYWERGFGYPAAYGTQAFLERFPGAPPRIYCWQCRLFIQKIRCARYYD